MVRAWLAGGKLKSFSLGDLVFIDEDDLQDFNGPSAAGLPITITLVKRIIRLDITVYSILPNSVSISIQMDTIFRNIS